MKTAFACAALVLIVSIFVIGCSKDDSDDAQQTTQTAAPVDTLPTSETVKLAIFERAFSECASTEPTALAAKYKLKNPSDQVLAEGVALGWVKFFKAGKDAVPDGRAGCMSGLRDEGS